MDCTKFLAALSAIESGRPGAAVCDAFRAHAANCPSCAEKFAPYRSKTCSDITDFLADYFDGGLDPAARKVFDFHVNACPECRCYLDGYADTMRRARDCAERDCAPPKALVDAILAARRAEKK